MTTVFAPRENVRRLTADAHGGPNHAELAALNLSPSQVLDFSASTNPFGAPPGVRDAIACCDIDRYPDQTAQRLRAALGERDGVPIEWLTPGNGAAGLLWNITQAFVNPGDRCLIIGPTFGEYRVACQVAGGEVVVTCAEPPLFQLDIPALAGALRSIAPRAVFLCNPNNPTGKYLGPTEVGELKAAAPDALWILDEAYVPFVTGRWSALPLVTDGHTVLLRSLTKDCALAGIRIGYTVALPELSAAISAVQPPWSVSAPAQAAALAALADPEDTAGSLRMLRAEAGLLQGALKAQGWALVSSATHFCLVDARTSRAAREHPELAAGAALRRELLQRHHLQIRDCASFGLPGYVRIAAQRPEANQKLIQVLEEWR